MAPRIQRSVGLIDAPVRAILRSLIAGEADWPLFLYGPVGTGKTCAALCLVDFAGGIYRTVPDLCRDLIAAADGRLYWEGGRSASNLWPYRLWQLIAQCPLFVLDELGMRNSVSDAHYEAVKIALDERYGRPLVLVSNVNLEDLARLYDDRIASRIGCGTVVELGGKDRRLSA